MLDRTKNWVEINDEECGTYNTNSQIDFKTSMLRSSLCDCCGSYILVHGTITVGEVEAEGGNNYIQVVFKSCAPFTKYKSKINNTQIDNAKCIYNLKEYSDNYSKTSGSL